MKPKRLTEERPSLSRAAKMRRLRRRAGLVLAVVATVLFAYSAIWGHNGVLGYASKRNEDRVLAAEIQKLAQENSKLKEHVDHLGSDPAAIEHEAREQMHYARPGEVIYTLPVAPAAGQAKPSAPVGRP